MRLMKDLSLNGRVLPSKAEGISISVYVSLTLRIPTVNTNKKKMIFFISFHLEEQMSLFISYSINIL